MAIAKDADLGTAIGAAGATTVALSTANAAASSSFIVLTVAWFGTTTLNTVAGGSLVWAIDKQFRSGSINVAFVSAQAASGLASSTSLTATFSGSSSGRMIGGDSFTGIATSSVTDGTAASSSGTGTAWSGGAVTTTNADDVIVGAAMRDAGADTTSTPGASYTELKDFGAGTGDNCTSVYRIVSATGSNTPTGTWLSTGNWAGIAVAYKAAVGGGGGPTDLPPRRALLGVGR